MYPLFMFMNNAPQPCIHRPTVGRNGNGKGIGARGGDASPPENTVECPVVFARQRNKYLYYS